MSTTQAFSKFGNNNSTCAIGAASLAFTGDVHDYDAVVSILSTRMHIVCPKCNRDRNSLTNVIIHMNDGHRTPRNEIADWLEGLGM